jgi:hypothetical protein
MGHGGEPYASGNKGGIGCHSSVWAILTLVGTRATPHLARQAALCQPRGPSGNTQLRLRAPGLGAASDAQHLVSPSRPGNTWAWSMPAQGGLTAGSEDELGGG